MAGQDGGETTNDSPAEEGIHRDPLEKDTKVRVCVCVCVRACVCACALAYMCARVCVRACVRVHVCICVRARDAPIRIFATDTKYRFFVMVIGRYQCRF